ncbi:ankyrin repeat, PH and SEC7 domain containing protein [Salix suchowensis]|nr:ankyrin repeat, PH and SEC7 domain containing protein [Salix suchowensis]
MASLAINIASSMIDRQLHERVRQDNIDQAFKSLVQTHLAEDLVTPCGNTLLHVAVSYGSDSITSYLAKKFPSLITTQNNQQDTVLHLAARRGTYSDAIKSLAQSNPSVARMTNEKGNTPLHDAVIKGNKELATFLVSKDPEVAYYNNMNGRSPLYLAVENGNKNGILDDLLNSGASIPIKREDGDALPKGKSPVHAAIERCDKDILDKIERAKPELLRLTDEELGNSLHYASSMGFLKGVEFLLENFHDGAYERDSEGNYPIHLACKGHSSVDVVMKEYLHKFPYPQEFLNKKGQNILHVAAENGNWSVISYILKQDPKLVEPLLNATDKDGNTPLHLAACYGQPMASFLLLLDNRVDRLIVNNKKSTPYDLAAEISRRADEQYEKTDEMTAGERKQNDSKNNTPADEIKGNKADSEKIAVDYFGAVMTLAILYFHARPKKPLSDLIQRPMPIRGQEVKSLIGNLLVAAVLVAGVTFAGAIQLPQLRDNINPGDQHHELNSTSRINSHEYLLDEYLVFDVGALSTSLVAALILLGATFNYPKFQIAAVVLSTSLVYWAIVMMFWALSVSAHIALLASHDWIVSETIKVTSYIFPLAYWLLIFPCFNPHPASQILLLELLHCFYYIYFLQSIFIISWLAHKLADLRRKLSRD